MSAEFEPPPTFALPVTIDAKGRQRFNEHWINWFYKLVNWLNAGGGPSPIPVPTPIDIQSFSARTVVTQTYVKSLRNDVQQILAGQVFGG